MTNLREFFMDYSEESHKDTELVVTLLGDYDQEEISSYEDISFAFGNESQQQDDEEAENRPAIYLIDPRKESVGKVTGETIDELLEDSKAPQAFVFKLGDVDDLTEQELEDLERVKSLLQEKDVPYFYDVEEALQYIKEQ